MWGKVRERLPLKSLVLKVISIDLFLDILLSFSENVYRAMLGQPKRLSHNYPRRNCGKCGEKSFYMFHSTDVLCTLSPLFVRHCCRCYLNWLLLSGQEAPVHTFDHRIARLRCVWTFFCFVLVMFGFSFLRRSFTFYCLCRRHLYSYHCFKIY